MTVGEFADLVQQMRAPRENISAPEAHKHLRKANDWNPLLTRPLKSERQEKKRRN